MTRASSAVRIGRGGSSAVNRAYSSSEPGVIFPSITVVLLMGQHLPDEHRSFLVPNPRDQAIAARVEDHQPTYLVGGRERTSYLLKSCPRRRLHHLVPTSQRPLRLGMRLPKLSERPTADYPHSRSTLRISRSPYYTITSQIAKSCTARLFEHACRA